jgi:FixJ family two-component response regulator
MARKKHQLFVAVVEDDDSLRLAVRDLLDSQGVMTRGFATAEAFLRSRQRDRVGCLILDVRLPGMSGVELHDRLRASGLSIPTIYATAEKDVDGKLQRRLLESGALAVLTKPFNPERLTHLVLGALSRQR